MKTETNGKEPVASSATPLADGPTFHIREARMAERTQVAALWAALMAHHRELDPRFAIASDGEARYARYAHEKMRSRDARVLVAEDVATGELIGYLLGEVQTRPPKAAPGLVGFISDIYVADGSRGAGVGSALFETMRRWFVARRATAIELYLAEANAPALAFWQALGLSPFLKLMHLDLPTLEGK